MKHNAPLDTSALTDQIDFNIAIPAALSDSSLSPPNNHTKFFLETP
ncbi:MAG: hypothetical protein ACRBEQ_00665 [Hyphomonas sp.]